MSSDRQAALATAAHAGSSRHALFESLTALIRRSCADNPLLIVLDDIHWSDVASVLMARYATRELRREPVVFPILYRDTDVTAESPLATALADLMRESESFQFEGLGTDEVSRFVKSPCET